MIGMMNNESQEGKEEPTVRVVDDPESQLLERANTRSPPPAPRNAKDTSTGTHETSGNYVSDDNLAENLTPEEGRNGRGSVQRMKIISLWIALVGMAASGAILGFGVTSEKDAVRHSFDLLAADLVHQLRATMNDYVVQVTWINQACSSAGGNYTMEDFLLANEYLQSTGMAKEGTACSIHLNTEEERLRYEADTRRYYDENYPGWPYIGVWGMQAIPGTDSFIPGPMPANSPPYLPTHWISNPDTLYKYTIDLDLYGTPEIQSTLARAFRHRDLALTGRIEPWEKFWLSFLPEEQQKSDDDALSTYRVLLYHPGLHSVDKMLSMIAIDIPRLLQVSHEKVPMKETASMYIFDTDPLATESFMGGATFHGDSLPGSPERVTVEDAIAMPELGNRHENAWIYEETFVIARREWTIAVASDRNEFPTNLPYVFTTAALILCASLALAWFLLSSTKRQAKMNQVKQAAKAEKVRLLLEHERQSAEQERHLNDYIAHEVRNPLSKALVASNFVTSGLGGSHSLESDKLESIRDDAQIVERSLRYINELLRTMLETGKADRAQLRVDTQPTDILCDLLEPVQEMIPTKNGLDIQVECPASVTVEVDRLRLQQIMINLGKNAVQHVEHGFVRLGARLLSDPAHTLLLYVEDSGPGIPLERRSNLFDRYQQSLERIHQGTGIGLFLSQQLAGLMGGSIWLDDTYHSGVGNCPGARFVVQLEHVLVVQEPAPVVTTSPQRFSSLEDTDDVKGVSLNESSSLARTSSEDLASEVSSATNEALPEKLSVLFCDDDKVLRKLFSRSLRRACPKWDIYEADCGENALELFHDPNQQSFDLIFLDQYMASTEQRMLGTDTVKNLRMDGCSALVCGLSANNEADAFLESGADAFLLKPISTSPNKLQNELARNFQGKYCENGSSIP